MEKMRHSARIYAPYAFCIQPKSAENLFATANSCLGKRRQVRRRVSRLHMKSPPDEVNQERRPEDVDDLRDLDGLPAKSCLVARGDEMPKRRRDAADDDWHQDQHERPEAHLEPMRQLRIVGTG